MTGAERAPVCFVDTETTGTHPEMEVWEVALIRRDYVRSGTARFRDRVSTFMIGDVDLSRADGFGLGVGRFYRRHPQYNGTYRSQDWRGQAESYPSAFGGHLGDNEVRLVSAANAARRVEEWTRGATLIGVGPAFDDRGLSSLLRRHELLPAWHYSLTDVKAMAAGVLHERARQLRRTTGDDGGLTAITLQPPWATDSLATELGLLPDEALRHTALGDAQFARALWDLITEDHR